jgi:hypothetical protein
MLKPEAVLIAINRNLLNLGKIRFSSSITKMVWGEEYYGDEKRNPNIFLMDSKKRN